jgi:hypothetical protein
MSYTLFNSNASNSLYVGTGGGNSSITNATVTTGLGAGTWSNNTTDWNKASAVIGHSGRMELLGDEADLVINGVSLVDALKGIQDRLNILRPNPAIEAEWDQLRELGDQYRKLEAELLEKQRAWDILKKQT